MRIENKITNWYLKVKRDFPFRNTTDPYKIWVSEIMSQQTQMSRVVGYYLRFIEMFPTVDTLAVADEEHLLKAWEGLGYYSRVRNMQVAAQTVMDVYGGKFPDNYIQLLELKGIGTYTAAAIASISFDEAVAAVDGNVLRVYARLIMMEDDILAQKTKNKVKKEMESWMLEEKPLNFNQGFIELGATVCTPTSPSCQECPLQAECLAYQTETIAKYPVKKKKAKAEELFYNTFILINEKGQLYMNKQATQFLGGMYLLPQFSDEDDLVLSLKALSEETKQSVLEDNSEFIGKYKHVFSHKIWQMNVYLISVKATDYPEKFVYPTKIPIANAHRNFLVSMGIIEK